MTTSCTHTVRGRAWSMNLGNPVDNAPYRLDRVDLIMLAGGRRQRSCTSWSDLRRRDLIGQASVQDSRHCGHTVAVSALVGGAYCTLKRRILPMWAELPL